MVQVHSAWLKKKVRPCAVYLTCVAVGRVDGPVQLPYQAEVERPIRMTMRCGPKTLLPA